MANVPRTLAAAFVIAAGFAVFLIWDQWHWWSSKPEYAFGFIVPLFVAYVCHERWPRMRALLVTSSEVRAPVWLRHVADAKAALGLVAGLALFALGAFYRAGGASQSASLIMAVGFAAIAVSLVYLSTPISDTAEERRAIGLVAGVRALLREPRAQVAFLFIFPALVWVVSAPLMSAVENSLSLFLLNKVTAVVFFAFDMLGLPLERHGNVLVLPRGDVGVAEACSGIRSLTGSIFAGSFLAAVFLDRLWKKIALVLSAMLLAFLTNIVRSLFLTGWAYSYGSQAIEGTVHDATGYAVLGLTCLGLLALIPLFNFRLDGGAIEDEAPPRPS